MPVAAIMLGARLLAPMLGRQAATMAVGRGMGASAAGVIRSGTEGAVRAGGAQMAANYQQRAEQRAAQQRPAH
jgi:hypothetical protein